MLRTFAHIGAKLQFVSGKLDGLAYGFVLMSSEAYTA